MVDQIVMAGTTFKKEPLTEVALLVQFDAIDDLTNSLLFRLWSDTPFRDRYPLINEYAELPPFIETFDDVPPSVKIEEVRRKLVFRFNYRNPDKVEQFQVQRDRAGFYWQRGAEDYPRFPHATEAFWRDFEILSQFLRNHNLQEPKPNQCAVSYTNRIAMGAGWSTPKEIEEVVTIVGNHTSKPLKENLELVDVASMRAYTIRDANRKPAGRLYVTLSATEDDSRDLDLRLTVRGAPKSRDKEGVQKFFQMSHDYIVDTFEAVTTPQMHRLWEKQ